MGWLRALGRRFGIGERRWLPDAQERDVHRRDVRRRLLDEAHALDEPPTTGGAPERGGARMTDIAPEPESGEGGGP
jgi:hypothetical protein